MIQNETVLKKESFKQKWGEIYQGVDVRHKINFSKSILFFVRRLVFVGMAFFISNSGIQLVLVNYVFMISFILQTNI